MHFLFVGDIHIGAIQNYFQGEDYIKPVTQTLKQIWQYARDNAIEDIIIGGDTFDTPFPTDEEKKQFLKCLDTRLQYHIILGNHDIATTQENSLNLLSYIAKDLGLMDNVHFYFTPEEVDIKGIKFNMLPYPYKKPTIEAPAVCIGHFETKGSIADNGKIFKEGIELDNNYVWLLGHLHRQQGNCYPGSILQCRFGEPVNKYFFDCSIDNNYKIEIEKISINTPYKLIDLIVQKLEDIKLEKENVYRLFVSEHLDLESIVELTKGYKVWQIKGITKNSTTASLTEADVDFQDSSLLDEMIYLRKWLENKEHVDLTEEQINKAIEIVEKIKGNQ